MKNSEGREEELTWIQKKLGMGEVESKSFPPLNMRTSECK